MAKAKRYDVARIRKLLAVIEAWIQSESGPARMDFYDPALAVHVKLRGWKRITLERKFEATPQKEKE